MPNRIIKETVKTSEKIDSLTWFEEVLYYRMLVTADDYGCLDGRTVLLKNELFPLKENVTKKSVEEAIAKLVKVGLLCRYTANDKPYLFFPTWEKHQRVRNKLRRFPDPYENGAEIICQSIDGQLTADCPPESESESESESIRESKGRKRAAFTPPTLEEVKAFCDENHLAVDEQRFFDYYESNGWMVGKNKMKSWEAALRNWARKGDTFGGTKKPERSVSFDIEEFESRMFKILD